MRASGASGQAVAVETALVRAAVATAAVATVVVELLEAPWVAGTQEVAATEESTVVEAKALARMEMEEVQGG